MKIHNKIKTSTIILFACVILSYTMMQNLNVSADEENLIKDIEKNTVISSPLNSQNTQEEKNIKEQEDENIVIKDYETKSDPVKIEYVHKLTSLSYNDSNFLINECEAKNVDLFLVLALYKKESNFNPLSEGKAGERGLGQLMDNTAKIISKNLGYAYDYDRLFDIKYNIRLSVAQISYLFKIYEGDLHKTLTAYNRGQQGLINYVNSGKSKFENKAISDYSNMVMSIAEQYKTIFDKLTLSL